MVFSGRFLSLATLFAVLILALSSTAVGATMLPARTSGSVLIGRAGKHGRYELRLRIPGDGAAVLTVEDKTLREVPSAQWNRYAVVPLTPLSSGTLRADFGSLGEVVLHFRRERSERRSAPEGCRGQAPLKEFGTYRGTIELRGEGGFFSVHRLEAPGRRRRRFPLRCAGGRVTPTSVAPALSAYVAPRIGPAGRTEAELEVLSESDERALAFDARSYPSDPLPESMAMDLEVRPDIAIGRYSYLAAPALFQTFEPEDRGSSLLTAMLGTLTYDADESSPETWSGDLDHTFLGGLEVIMNGPGSQTRLCSRGKEGRSCVGAEDPLLPGSPLWARAR